MGRILLMAVLVYGYGDPGFDGHRPAALERPLRNFHRAVDVTAVDARRALVAVDNTLRLVPTLPADLRSLYKAL